MKRLIFRKASVVFISTLASIVFGVGIFGASLVHRERLMEQRVTILACHTQDCEKPAGNPICASSCLTAFGNNFQTLPANMLNFALSVFLFSLLWSVVLYFVWNDGFLYSKSFIRQRRQRFILSFFAQLGSWLVLFEKRDPALIFATV